MKLIFLALGFLAIVGFSRFYSVLSEKHSYVIARGNIFDSVYNSGKVKSDRVFKFNSRTAFKEGEIIKKGSALLYSEGRVVLQAPFTGVIHLTSASSNIIELKDISDRYISVVISPKDFKKIKLDQEVRIHCDVFQKESHVGRVEFLSSKSNAQLVKISANSLPESVLPGADCNVEIRTGQKINVALVPINSLRKGHVWVKGRSGFPRKEDITLGVINKEWGEVVSGNIKVGDRVLIF